MKFLIGIILILFSNAVDAQDKDIKIAIGFEKRVYLIFDTNVHKVDWAEKDSIAIEWEENKVIIQGRADDISESNALVETVDGYNYSFILNSVNNPTKVTYVIQPTMSFFKSTRLDGKNGKSQKESSGSYGTIQSPTSGDEGADVPPEIKKISEQIEKEQTEATGLARVDKRMTIFIGGIYVHENKLFFKVLLENTSSVAYDIDLISFTIEQGAGNIKKTAVEKPKLKNPDFVLNGDSKKIVKGTVSVFVFVFDKFTFDKKETLYCEVWEVGGKRKIRVPIPLNKVLNAKAI